jgi:hypothetical protein
LKCSERPAAALLAAEAVFDAATAASAAFDGLPLFFEAGDGASIAST